MTASPQPVEFLYGIRTGHYDGNDDWQDPQVVAFRITKKTPRRIYYVAEEFVAYAPRIRYVDRQEIERTGQLIRRTASWWEPDFALHLTPPVLERPKIPSSVSLKAEMAAAHPDRGGSDAEFIAARQRYERARTAERGRP